MKTFVKQKDVEWINTATGEKDDFQTQHFDADGEEVDSRRNTETNGNARFVSELAVKTLDKIPMKKAKSMFQVVIGKVLQITGYLISEF